MGLENIVKIIFQGENQTGPGASGAAASIKQVLSAATVLSAEFLAIKAAVSEAFEMVEAAIRPAYEAVENYNLAVAKTAALVSSFQTQGDLGENYRKAKDYAEALIPVLETIDAKTIASAQDLGLMTEEMVKQRIVLDINNQKQLEAFTNIANAAAVVSSGAPSKEIQLRQEIRSLLQGEVLATNQLAQQLDAIVGGNLKEQVALHKKSGDLVEWLGGKLQGYAAASGDIESTWASIGSTMDSIKNRVLREGFKDAYVDINGLLQQMNGFLKEHADDISIIIHKTWLAVKGVIETIAGLLSTQEGIGKLMLAVGWAVGKILDGLGMVAYIILPMATDKTLTWIRMLGIMVNIAYVFGAILIDALTIVGKTLWNVGKILWNALTGDKEGMRKAMDDFANQAIGEPLKEHIDMAKEMFKDLGAEGKKLVSLDDFDRRYNEWNKKIQRKTAATPELPPAPEDDKKKKKEKEFDWAASQMKWADRNARENEAALKAEEEFNIKLADAGDNRLGKRLAEIEKERRHFEESWAMRASTEEEYQRRMTKINELARMQREKAEAEYSFKGGAMTAMKEYAEMATNTAQQVHGAFTNALRGVEDAFVRMATTGKISFKDLANSIISDLVRIAVQRSITGPLANALGGFFGSLLGGAGATGSFNPISSGGGYSLAGGMGLKYHGGGIVRRFHFGGLASDEVPAILQTEEGVLSRRGMSALDRLNNGGGLGGVNVVVNVENKTGAQVRARTTESFNAKGMVKGIILELIDTDPTVRNAMGV